MNGYDLSKLSDQKISRLRNRSIGFVFQMNNLLAEFSALENIMMPGLIAGLDKQTVKSRAEQLLEAVELPHRASHRPGELSGGEQQRIAVARALLMTPAILLADEPTGNLDNRTSATIQELLFNLCQHYKITMLLVTHDEALARKMPQRIVMEDGCIIDRG
jgi:lipoprotein-releasing system ATP-binding protein